MTSITKSGYLPLLHLRKVQQRCQGSWSSQCTNYKNPLGHPGRWDKGMNLISQIWHTVLLRYSSGEVCLVNIKMIILDTMHWWYPISAERVPYSDSKTVMTKHSCVPDEDDLPQRNRIWSMIFWKTVHPIFRCINKAMLEWRHTQNSVIFKSMSGQPNMRRHSKDELHRRGLSGSPIRSTTMLHLCLGQRDPKKTI